MTELSIEECPKCTGETEFVQFGGADSPVVATTPEEVGDGLLALFWCLDCSSGIEYILQPSDVTVVEE